VDVAMLRDVVERHAVSNVAGLRWLVRHLLGNAAGLFSVEMFYGALKSQGFSISKDTVHQLMGFLQDCFLVRAVLIEAASERQRMVNPRKAYPVDPGLIPVFDRSGRANVGHALETAILVELERRRAEVTYVRMEQGFEVDFLARYPGGEIDLIQVRADASESATAEREIRALVEAGRRYPKARKCLLTLTLEGSPPKRRPICWPSPPTLGCSGSRAGRVLDGGIAPRRAPCLAADRFASYPAHQQDRSQIV
jgi:uncharacterized protein